MNATMNAATTSAPALPCSRRMAAVPRVASVRPNARRPAAFSSSLSQRSLRVLAASQPQSQQQVVDGPNEERWDAQVTEGKVRNLSGADIRQHLADGWVLLDVRPPSEASKARIQGAVEVPLFLEDESVSLSSLIKRASAFGMGGWWLGGTHMVPNPNFMQEVQAKVPKTARLVVGCQKGLRSLAACEQLSLAGYETLAWVNGGFDSCKKGEVPTVGDVDIRFAGIGGLSEAIGWTEVQQEQNKGLGSVDGALKLVGVILVADLVLFAWEYIQAYQAGRL
ncbi:hypothetical protein PLESTB_000857900 [Pleodorina starrii]|uniref:Rhodanese domain-containing protein n=1 Tax=Pleodorina starrii TaxID=330485 RepID=A0A9W6BM08_9CHLO|nr:hypothetical protein PLESTM_001436000 [Pleodorina starrii]GLC54383.1 hypothetical protein PLESTB_000857900 [Pleodorina starrii]GLC72034.1 hypothetical protein PLESTF_001197100 [Pleodorina starrii]